MCIMVVVGYLMARKIKYCWLMMNPIKHLEIWSGVAFCLESFWGELLSTNKVQLSDLAFHLWPALIKLPSMSTIQDHYDVLVKYLKPCLSSYSWNYSWFMQYMNCDNGDPINAQPSLGMHSKSLFVFIFDLSSHFLSYMLKKICYMFFWLALNFVCSWLCLLLTNCMMAFVVLKGKKWCLPLRFLFWNNMDIITYLTITKVIKQGGIDLSIKICIIWRLFKIIFHLW
jgi:hypothetical protein